MYDLYLGSFEIIIFVQTDEGLKFDVPSHSKSNLRCWMMLGSNTWCIGLIRSSYFNLQAASLPMSIIIIGIGDADFEGRHMYSTTIIPYTVISVCYN